MTHESPPQDVARCPVTGAVPSEAPGPKGLPLAWPVVGSTILYAADPPAFVLRAQAAHGTVVKLPMIPHNPTLQVTAPEAIRRILQGNTDNYCRGAYYEAFKLFMGHGLLTLDDGDWRGHRQVVNPAFTPNAIAARAAETDAAVAELINRWAEFARTGRPFDLYAESMRLTCRVIGHALVGRDLSRESGEFARALSVALEAIFKEVGSLEKMVPSFVPTPYRRRVNRARRTLERVIARAARDVDLGSGGEVAALIRDSDLPEDAFWSDLVTLMLAGVETTALALAWTLYETARHPEVRDGLEEETDRVLVPRQATFAPSRRPARSPTASRAWEVPPLAAPPESPSTSSTRTSGRHTESTHPTPLPDGRTLPAAALGGGLPLATDLDGLTYTGMVVDEALRMHPPVWQFPRQTIEDDVLADHHVPAGTPVLVSVYGAHHNPEQWKEPERFDPERFRPGGAPARDRLAYLPFGGGRRQCIGKKMGLALLRQTVAAVHSRFRLTLTDDEAARSGAFITLFPKGGIQVTAEERAR